MGSLCEIRTLKAGESSSNKSTIMSLYIDVSFFFSFFKETSFFILLRRSFLPDITQSEEALMASVIAFQADCLLVCSALFIFSLQCRCNSLFFFFDPPYWLQIRNYINQQSQQKLVKNVSQQCRCKAIVTVPVNIVTTRLKFCCGPYENQCRPLRFIL